MKIKNKKKVIELQTRIMYYIICTPAPLTDLPHHYLSKWRPKHTNERTIIILLPS